jgi:hypothetical protein
MYGLIAAIACTVAGFLASRSAAIDRREYDRLPQRDDDPHLRALLLHIRQDLQFGIYLLLALIIVLGIATDLITGR